MYKEGEPGNMVYIIKTGEFEVSKKVIVKDAISS